MNLIANGIGAISMLLVFISYQMNDRRKILIYQIMISLIWVIHFYLLEAYAAAAINLIGAARAVAFYFRGRYRWASAACVPAAFCCASLIATALTWSGGLDVLAAAATVLQTIALWMRMPKHIRLLSLPASPMWLIYDILNRSYVGMITECFVLSSLLIAMWRFDIRSRKEKFPAENGN